MRYEDLRYSDEILPIIFRKDSCTRQAPGVLLHWHEAVELLWVVEGRLAAQSNTEYTVAEPGDVLCVHSNHLHGYSAVGEACTYYCLILPAQVIGSERLYQSALPLKSRGESAELYRKIVTVLEEKNPFYQELAKSLIVQLYVCLAKEGGRELPGSDRKMTATVKAALGYIEEHYAEELDVEGIARSVGVSRYHLCHIFKEVTGKTLAGYWQNVRCDKAKKMLRAGASVAEAAEQCGFSSPGYFTKVYQKHFSVLPRQEKR